MSLDVTAQVLTLEGETYNGLAGLPNPTVEAATLDGQGRVVASTNEGDIGNAMYMGGPYVQFTPPHMQGVVQIHNTMRVGGDGGSLTLFLQNNVDANFHAVPPPQAGPYTFDDTVTYGASYSVRGVERSLFEGTVPRSTTPDGRLLETVDESVTFRTTVGATFDIMYSAAGAGTIRAWGSVSEFDFRTGTGALGSPVTVRVVGDTGETIGSPVEVTLNASERYGRGYSHNVFTELSLSMWATPVTPLTVTADYDADPADDGFGTYLSGVQLPTTFTASVSDADNETRKFRFSIDGFPQATRTLGRGPAGAKFKFDVGRLPPAAEGGERDYPVKIEALAADGSVLDAFTGTIKVTGRLALDLKVKATIDAGNATAVEQARVIAGAGVAPKLDFQPAITGIDDTPKVNGVTVYKGKLALSFFNRTSGTVAQQLPLSKVQGGQLSLGQPYSAGFFANVVADPAAFDYDIHVTPTNGSKLGSLRRFSDAEQLRVVQLPSWIAKNASARTYVADDSTAGQYGPGAAAYKFVVNTGRAFNLPLPVSTDTPFDLLKGLPSGVKLDADFSVYASLFDTEAAKAVPDKVKLTATLLGDPVFQAGLDPAKLEITTTLNARTLAEPESVTLQTAGGAAINLLDQLTGPTAIDRAFGPWKISVPIFTLGFAELRGTVALKGMFHAEVSKLELTGSITFKFKDGKVALDQTTGTLALDAVAKATASLGVDVGVNVTVFGYKVVDLLDASGTGTVTLDFSARVAANFGGPKVITLDRQESTATMKAKYNFDYDISFLTKDPNDSPEMKNATGQEEGSIWDLTV